MANLTIQTISLAIAQEWEKSKDNLLLSKLIELYNDWREHSYHGGTLYLFDITNNDHVSELIKGGYDVKVLKQLKDDFTNFQLTPYFYNTKFDGTFNQLSENDDVFYFVMKDNEMFIWLLENNECEYFDYFYHKFILPQIGMIL